jgi:hypothetical protein
MGHVQGQTLLPGWRLARCVSKNKAP